jgi:DNA-binding transcriptional ArsR family regulator
MGQSGEGDKRCKGKADPGEIEYVDSTMARAMAHPLRVQILGVLNKRVMSPSGFARTYDLKLQNTSYHFRFLKELGLIEEVDSRQVRGSTEHFYAAVKRVLFDGRAWDELPPSIKAQVSARILSDFLEAVATAMDHETFDSSDERMAVWVQQRLDDQGWVEAVAAQRQLVHSMEGIYKGSRLRLLEAGEPESGMLGTFGAFLFESPAPPEQGESEDEE